MSQMSRRDFLRMAAAGMGALALEQFLAACGQKEIPQELLPTATQFPVTPTSIPTATQIAAVEAPASPTATGSSEEIPASEAPPTATATPMGAPDLVVARHGEPEALVRQAMAAMGGIEKFVPKGAKVIVKPNMCVAYHSYEYAATTNPWVVGTLVKMCLEAGAASVKVMDAPFGGTAKEAYAISGIDEQVKAAGGEMTFMPGFRYVEAQIPNAVKLKKTYIYDEILQADVLIDVPIAKTHSLAGLTLGMKNLMGVVRDRSALHRYLGENLADLANFLRPTLTVVDAVRILRDHGPTGGNLNDVEKLDTLIVSQDIVAADSYAATLFGKQPEDLSFIKAGREIGLGRSDLNSLRIEEINVGV
jgi:uncharacterized protein (DUF362 family)